MNGAVSPTDQGTAKAKGAAAAAAALWRETRLS